MIDLSTATATDALDALARGSITSEALLTAQLERVERFNPVLNAVVAMDLDGALRDARAADEARRQGRLTGPLHGLPMTIKDIFATRGLVTTSGHAPLSDYRPEADAPAVAALRAAGAVVFGKTNLPEFGGDIQSYNDIHGLCRNPWNPDRTAGGSSGGAGAALASGMTLLELGSDIGGSIRVPCHYNGVFGHKPTWNAVDRFGESPRPPVWAHALMDLVVAGPMGRSVADVRLGLDVLTAITTGGIPGARLPPASPRSHSARGLRVAIHVEDPAAPTSAACKAAVREVGARLAAAGAQVTEPGLPGLDLAEQNILYRDLLNAAMSPGYAASHQEWKAVDERRHRLRADYARFFQDHDVLLAPIAPTPAFPHVTEGSMGSRKLTVDGVEISYLKHLVWAGLPTLPGLPATAVPVALSDEGLPMGLQVIGPLWADQTTLAVAGLIETLNGGFRPPPGY
ncbi:MAG: amidase family protein [Phenylobacterium sp.]|jgi:amidase